MKEGDKVCKSCSTVVFGAKEKEKCPICKKEMEPYKKEKENKVECP